MNSVKGFEHLNRMLKFILFYFFINLRVVPTPIRPKLNSSSEPGSDTACAEGSFSYDDGGVMFEEWHSEVDAAKSYAIFRDLRELRSLVGVIEDEALELAHNKSCDASYNGLLSDLFSGEVASKSI